VSLFPSILRVWGKGKEVWLMKVKTGVKAGGFAWND